MRKWTTTAGLLFLAASSVYIDQAALGESRSEVSPVKPVNPDDPRLLEETADPFAQPTEVAAIPVVTGNSVTETDVTVSDAGTVEIHVNGASLVEVLRMLSLQSQRNIVASKDVRGTITANLYDVTVREALDAILHANGYAYREKGNFIYVYTVQELAEIEKSERKMETKVFRLYYTPAANAVNMIKPVLSGNAQVAFTTPALSGIESGGNIGGNSHAVEDVIVVTDYAENLERAEQVLKLIDERPQQVLIEATILRATLTDDNALGVDFTILGGVDFSTLSTDNGQIIGSDIASNTTVDGRMISGGTGTNFTESIAGGLKVGFVSSDVSVFVSALESITDTTVLANPKVLALNKQKGEVLVGREDGYLTTTVTESAAVQTVEFLKTGTRLIFRPYIGNDGYIRMEIHPEDSSGGLADGNLPFKVTTEVTTNVMVKDGHTIVIGGLFREDSTAARSQVPVLGNLPLAGPLFRRQRDRTTREEVIILLTPHIVKNDTAYAAASADLLHEAHQLRVGVRKGMMPWGRERLAEGSYEAAMKELASEDPNHRKALWHLDAATNLNPKFIEAIRLKQSLTGREITSVDNSTIHSFVKRQILAEQLNPAPVKLDPATLDPSTVDPAADSDPAAIPDAPAETESAAVAPATQPAVTSEAVSQAPTTQPIDAPQGESFLGSFWKSFGRDNPDVATATTSDDGRSTVTVLDPAIIQTMEPIDPTPVELPFTITELPTEEIPATNK